MIKLQIYKRKPERVFGNYRNKKGVKSQTVVAYPFNLEVGESRGQSGLQMSSQTARATQKNAVLKRNKNRKEKGVKEQEMNKESHLPILSPYHPFLLFSRSSQARTSRSSVSNSLPIMASPYSLEGQGSTLSIQYLGKNFRF